MDPDSRTGTIVTTAEPTEDPASTSGAAPEPPAVGPGSPADAEERRKRLRTDLGRAAQVFLGLFSVVFAVIVLATLQFTLRSTLVLLGETIVIVSAQTLLAGGRLISESWLQLRAPRFAWRAVGAWGIVGVGLLGLALSAFVIFDPNLAVTGATFALATVLALLGVGRLFQAFRVSAPLWLRGSLVSTGALILLCVVIAVAFEGLALESFAILAGVVLLVTGVETIVTGLHPTDPRQFVLLKLLLFSAFYGLVLINWIDLFGKTVPAYGVWLILTYMAPFAVLIVFEGWRSWPLAVSLGLLVSLMNDVGYFFIGNLIFGFHQNLGPWIAGQLGLLGNHVVTYFEGGTFTITVTSWMMGLSIYARAAVVGVILYYWWRHPGRIIAKIDGPSPTRPA